MQWLFRLCKENGYVYKGHYTGQYCIYDNAYVNEAKPGDPCPDCGRPTETVTEENYFFKLSAFQKPLLDFYKKFPNFIQPETRKNEIVSFVEGGLKDLSITRTTIRWGIPVPGEEPHVFYVWFDALTAYLSAVGGPEYEKRGMWPADVHLVGKDIIRFHTVYWPAFLMAAMLPLPKQVWAHGWFLMDATKMSKSKGNVVLPRPIVNMLGMDALRYFLLREVVFGQDGNFSYDALVTRYNSDLANGLGNLASRTAAMLEKNFAGKVPKPGAAICRRTMCWRKKTQKAIGEVLERYDKFEFARASGGDLGGDCGCGQISDHRAAVGAREFAGRRVAKGDDSVDDRGTAAHCNRTGSPSIAGEHRQGVADAGIFRVRLARWNWMDCAGGNWPRE